jgi:hypothetical protein
MNFKFDPQAVGLSTEMTAKYFLQEFSLDIQRQEENCQAIQADIKEYFQELRKMAGESEEAQASKAARLGSVSTNGSVGHLEEFKGLSQSERL